jgi:hypothetical protein
VEVGDLSRREIKSDKAVIGLFSHHGNGQKGGKRGPQAAIGQALCLAPPPILPKDRGDNDWSRF